MAKCAYCTKDIEKGTGLMFVKRTGVSRYYCSNRCFKFDNVQQRKPKRKEIKELSKAGKKNP